MLFAITHGISHLRTEKSLIFTRLPNDSMARVSFNGTPDLKIINPLRLLWALLISRRPNSQPFKIDTYKCPDSLNERLISWVIPLLLGSTSLSIQVSPPSVEK